MELSLGILVGEVFLRPGCHSIVFFVVLLHKRPGERRSSSCGMISILFILGKIKMISAPQLGKIMDIWMTWRSRGL